MANNRRSRGRRGGRGRGSSQNEGAEQKQQDGSKSESSGESSGSSSSPKGVDRSGAQKSGGKSRRGRSRRGRGARGKPGRPRTRVEDMYIKLPDPIPERDYAPCPVCGKAIEHVFSAVAHESNGLPAHIECIVGQLNEREQLDEGDRIVYLGRGCFGVVGKDPVVEDGKKRFNVKRRIQYEAGGDPPQWRRELSPGISRDYRPEPKPLEEAVDENEQTLRESLGTNRDAIYMPRLN